MTDDFNQRLVEECAKAIYGHCQRYELDELGLRGITWEELDRDTYEGMVIIEDCRTKARACLSRAAELTFGKIKSDIEPKITDRALKASAAEWWRMRL
jgi:hypothetical protein